MSLYLKTLGAAVFVAAAVLLLRGGRSDAPGLPTGSAPGEREGRGRAEPPPSGEQDDASGEPIPGMSFVPIPAGSFQMGSPATEPGRTGNEDPVHAVSVASFEMMTTEVTQGMWEQVMGGTIQDQQRLSEFDAGLMGTGDAYPMYFVSWYDCGDFVDAMNLLDPACTYRLPSEAEWEYACRAGSNTAFYWGNVMDWDCCWCDGNSGGLMHPVGEKQPNAWGLFDMSGNAWEWCQDCWHEDYQGAPSNGAAWESPWSPYQVFRGGSWFNEPLYSRSAYRYAYEPSARYYIGFRLARSPR